MMAPITREVILSDLDRAKILISNAEHSHSIVPKEIEKLVVRYESILEKWKSTKFNVVDADTKAAKIIEKYNIVLKSGLRPIT